MEFAILYELQSWHGPILDALATFITTLGNKGAIWIALVLVLLYSPRTRSLGVALAIALLLTQFTGNMVIKPLIERPRPSWIDTTVPLLIDNPQDFSFPSGHTASSLAAATVLVLNRYRYRWAFAALALGIAGSRLYLFVHFPTDVLAGALLGIAMAAFVTACYRRWQRQCAARSAVRDISSITARQ